jgi:Rrf2 family transcriptional regulator, nitric oxide-sensitive transcriptional repressor
LIHLSDAALIAVHALAGLASQPGQLVQVKDLAAAIGASEHHLSKVMQRLARSSLVRSVKGPTGGFILAMKPAEISFKLAIEAVDGPMGADFCPYRTERCSSDNCIFGPEIRRHANELLAYMDQRTIADIMPDHMMSPAAV